MTITIQDLTTKYDASQRDSLALPFDETGFEGFFLFDGAQQNAKNYALGKPALRVIGAPVQGDGFVTVAPYTNYFVGPNDSVGKTWLIALRVYTPIGSYVIGNYGGAGSFSALYTAGAGAATGLNTGGPNIYTGPLPANTWCAVLATCDASTGVRTLKEITTGSINATTTGTTSYTPGSPLLLGSGYDSGGSGHPFDVAAWFAASRCLSDVEIAAHYVQMQAILAAQSTPIAI